ncbi:MAG: nicotinamide mononucleotide transporter [Formosa sp.]|jgi:nicotinamide mononucleotide transporter|nr:nicotinamide mononucleotide transporter [Formosa sp.]MDA9646647.1 nicotinamide riboside transporter PnuC [Flavobacteriaceae bacterium]MDC0462860.1 nicotinamide riboside transporter PnuC [Flavobacteriaceae bacterium]MDC3350634.1 nicotinamide riboside transporter PnuC [Flavobacteriaceae bacterium]
MNQIFNLLFEQYSSYAVLDIIMEITAVFFGFASVWYSKQNNILVFPTGLISTSIFVYLLFKWQLLGDMMINGYYFIMSIYGWYVWTRKVDTENVTPISRVTKREQKFGIVIFVSTLVLVYEVYQFFEMWTNWVAYVDTLTTALFFVGMWLMAKRKIENWYFWIIADIISVPLYLYKGLTFTSIQYFGFTILAIFGFLAWKKNLSNSTQTVLE